MGVQGLSASRSILQVQISNWQDCLKFIKMLNLYFFSALLLHDPVFELTTYATKGLWYIHLVLSIKWNLLVNVNHFICLCRKLFCQAFFNYWLELKKNNYIARRYTAISYKISITIPKKGVSNYKVTPRKHVWKYTCILKGTFKPQSKGAHWTGKVISCVLN